MVLFNAKYAVSTLFWLLISFGFFIFFIKNFIIRRLLVLVSNRKNYIKQQNKLIEQLKIDIASMEMMYTLSIKETENEVDIVIKKALDEFHKEKKEKIRLQKRNLEEECVKIEKIVAEKRVDFTSKLPNLNKDFLTIFLMKFYQKTDA